MSFAEKPFEGVNGSGKHNNWSISTNTGVNLLSPGETPHENAQFLLFLCAVIKAVDDYQDLLRISVASAGNDHRLGANEAPPAVVSIFLGDELTAILESIASDVPYLAAEKTQMRLGVHILPKFPKDATDRNRTSPFAFTGNKFEFRMLGSASSISMTNVVINTAVAESLCHYADELENAEDLNEAIHNLIKRTFNDHKHIIFNGNGYDSTWLDEAKKRGLLNLPATPDCVPHFLDKKNIDLFEKHKVFTETELRSRYDIMLENYCKILNIEGRTMIDMVRKEILPSVSAFTKDLSDTVVTKQMASKEADCTYEIETVNMLSKLLSELSKNTCILEQGLDSAVSIEDNLEEANYYKNKILKDMEKLRSAADECERYTAQQYWPFPTYGDLLYGVR